MSNIDIIRPEVAANLGNFLVGRLLPFKQKRAVGPFVFIDHMGPAEMSETENLDVAPHPHIGLSTLTYLFEGSVMHRDSLGNELEIKPGAVNFMTAGKGVVHSERTPDYLRHTKKNLHGLQIWIALPKNLEEIAPSFHHIEANALPTWQENNIHYQLIAGEVLGKKAPVPVYSKLYMIEIIAEETRVIDLSNQLYGESGLYILEGSISSENNTYGDRQILITSNAHLCKFTIHKGSKVYIFGGEPFEEERFIFWNFVSTSKERIEKAKADWKAQRFPKVPNETEFVPLPEIKPFK